MSTPIRIGFLGAGLIATYHSKSLRRSGAEQRHDVVRAGVFDPDAERAAAFARASGHTVMASEDGVLDSCDAVYVCTWTSEHARQVAKAVERGLAVFCEKPLAVDLATAREMTELVTASGVVNQVGLVLRRSPAYRWARHLIDDPAAGRIMSVVFRDDQFIPIQGHYASTWRARRELVGSGTLLEHSIHDIDMLRYLVGDVERVSANTANFHGHDGIEDVASASFAFAGGAIGTLTSVWHDNLARPSLRRVEMFCERRFVVIEGDDWYGPVHWTDHDGTGGSLTGVELAGAAASLHDGTRHADGDTDGNPDGAFVDALAAGTPAWPDFGVALRSHEIVDAMYRSAAAGGRLIRMAPTAGVTGGLRVVELAAEETHPVRLAVLRANTPTKEVAFAEDTIAGTVHLGVRDGDTLVATSSWVPRPWSGSPEEPAIQLRGMATVDSHRSHGVGAMLLRAGLERARDAGAALVWANARDAALAFYLRHGFEVRSDGFIDATTQLPHHQVVHRLHG